MEPFVKTIDETIREGMQHRGLVFSYGQRLKMVEFMETLGIDVCQAGYPPAHSSEKKAVKNLNETCRSHGYRLGIAGMGRAVQKDAECLLETGIDHFHLHFHVKESFEPDRTEAVLEETRKTAELLRKNREGATISLAVLDIGKTGDDFLGRITDFLIRHTETDLISLPDTSGIIPPDRIYEKITPLARNASKVGKQISVHCHNDMGMAGANTFMGIKAGGTVMEASVLGIGERNGIADLYPTAKMLRDNGFSTGVRVDDMDTFARYYGFVDTIYREQTGETLITYNTPVFGKGGRSHVAGTHAGAGFGTAEEEEYFLNVLCGKNLVKRYLEQHRIPHAAEDIPHIAAMIKEKSAQEGRRLDFEEIRTIARPD